MKICFCLHNHQPVGNFDHVMNAAYSNCYLPMLEVFENHSGIRTGLHISGTLLEWLVLNHPEYLERTGELCLFALTGLALIPFHAGSVCCIVRRFACVQTHRQAALDAATRRDRHRGLGLKT